MATAVERRAFTVVVVRPVWIKALNTWALRVDRCPFCGHQHCHGGGDDWRKQIGTRRDAGCPQGGTYTLAPIEAGRGRTLQREAS
jgi:hypothetical protein